MISVEKIFPTILIVFDLGAAFVYIFKKEPDIRMAIYWFAAALLTTVVTY
jgi:hypothetical protein